VIDCPSVPPPLAVRLTLVASSSSTTVVLAAPPLAVSVSKLPPVALVMLAVTVLVPWS
jgi:hypothetical protein